MYLLVSISCRARQKVWNVRRAMSRSRWPMGIWRFSGLVFYRGAHSPIELIATQPALVYPLIHNPSACNTIRECPAFPIRFPNRSWVKHIKGRVVKWFCRRFLAFYASLCASALQTPIEGCISRLNLLPLFPSCIALSNNLSS